LDTLRESPTASLRLRVLLEVFGLNQSDLARGAGVSRATVSSMMGSRKKRPRKKTREQVAQVLRDQITADLL